MPLRRLRATNFLHDGADGTGRVSYRRPPCCAGEDGDALFLRELDRLGVEHARSGGRHLLHFLIAELGYPPRRGYDAWIGGIHAVDI